MNFTVPDVQQALLDALKAHFAASSQVVVDFGLPTKVPTKRERIYVEADEDGLQRTRSGFTTEAYTLRVLVEVKQLGQTPSDYQTCSDRRWALINEVAGVLHSSVFRKYLNEARDVVAAESGSGPIDKGFIAHTRIHIPVQVRG